MRAYPDFTGTRPVVNPHPIVSNQDGCNGDEKVRLDNRDEYNRSNDLSQCSNEHADSVAENVIDGIHVYIVKVRIQGGLHVLSGRTSLC